MTYRDYVMELLKPSGDFSGRAMFGGYGIFEGGDMFALVSQDDRLCFKVDDSNRGDYEAAGSERLTPMPYYVVPEEVLEDPATLAEWAARSVAIAHASAKKKKRR